MNKYIYTDELKSWVENWFYMHRYYHPYSKSNDIPITELYDILERMHPTNAVEVVRCKDCVDMQKCRYGQYLGLEGFCSHGERR